ncbi:class I SAM-dependent methyltransferase [Alkalihalobacterium alkalinitrilicum]|uniref:class I SAM-dependent methyltransferase n=1 Tax=Alkalihalobacterium alkalinitrilicum TaxID=427920 RepID=UPI000995C5BA|nr:class I SAM-dependent methyltransferase [Alkalihalobacterium alkalinitrilicum]
MGIDFHSNKNRGSYTSRKADKLWGDAITHLVPIEDISVALEVGCGGGIYCKALSEMGVNFVTGVDFSDAMLEGARENCKDYPNISFKNGSAFQTGVESNHYDLLLERALIHHINDLRSCFAEGNRVLKDGGYYIVQDRTPEDCLLVGSDRHIRGYFFELFPKLKEKELNRRHKSQLVIETLKKVGFNNIEEMKLWETRKVYDTKEQLLQDLSERTGRSILHELDNVELNRLVNHIDHSLPTDGKIVERDRWTIWKAVK